EVQDCRELVDAEHGQLAGASAVEGGEPFALDGLHDGAEYLRHRTAPVQGTSPGPGDGGGDGAHLCRLDDLGDRGQVYLFRAEEESVPRERLDGELATSPTRVHGFGQGNAGGNGFPCAALGAAAGGVRRGDPLRFGRDLPWLVLDHRDHGVGHVEVVPGAAHDHEG